eukprot:CAMPEP_0116104954 /NCGR_PEP_ID=MMETSP0327-20121206/14750_1 /TAXON_ID=44447 /ORGANISM="Pseudo-nitzschia delicatissima, Strain B596" /LENGTH=665 /DNA_ID=CAMNT_0003597279 /DNA_START=324 /DNA_END=2321 /DNA_ORIENTATION=+
MTTSQDEEADVSAGNKRQKTMHENSIQEDSDPFLTFIPETVLATTLSATNNEKSPSSLKSLRLPSKLAYPFWYDPHPIAKWAADRLKGELPPYTMVKTETPSGETEAPSIALGKMYGVLVVSQPSGKIGYLKAYSGTMPRPQYGGRAKQETDSWFVPSVFDRFAKASEEDGGDGFDYERDEEVLNSLTREIQKLDSCPERKRRREDWKESKSKLEKEIADAKKVQKSNKRRRKARRNKLRARLLEDEKDLPPSGFEKEKDAHAYFLEHNEEYRNLEDQLVQESALDQREFKALKAKIEVEVEIIGKALEEQCSQIENLKQRRKNGSNDLQQKLFDQYKLLNVHGETKTPVEIFKDTPLRVPPSGTGDCAAIKLFQHAFSKRYRPIALAEFWWGPSPHASEGDVARTHGNYYPCCRGKCEPILSRHILLGTDVESDPLTECLNIPHNEQTERELSIVYEDEWLVVVDKPHDVLSVPGRNVQDSIKTDLQRLYPNATGPILVHRLDYSTSGLLLAAKDSNTHKLLQAQFINRTVKKCYTALLNGNLLEQKSIETQGSIGLPLAGDYLNRPMQKVERGPEGKPAMTFYEIVQDETPERSRTRIHFYPQTGRTHQLRVHASHPEGLGMAIVGDDIYGQRDERLCLHAGLLEIDHPFTKKRVTFRAPVPF